jgi:hypothetical protein
MKIKLANISQKFCNFMATDGKDKSKVVLKRAKRRSLGYNRLNKLLNKQKSGAKIKNSNVRKLFENTFYILDLDKSFNIVELYLGSLLKIRKADKTKFIIFSCRNRSVRADVLSFLFPYTVNPKHVLDQFKCLNIMIKHNLPIEDLMQSVMTRYHLRRLDKEILIIDSLRRINICHDIVMFSIPTNLYESLDFQSVYTIDIDLTQNNSCIEVLSNYQMLRYKNNSRVIICNISEEQYFGFKNKFFRYISGMLIFKPTDFKIPTGFCITRGGYYIFIPFELNLITQAFTMLVESSLSTKLIINN